MKNKNSSAGLGNSKKPNRSDAREGYGAGKPQRKDRAAQPRRSRARSTAEMRLRQIIDLVPHFIFAKDAEGKFILVNQALADAYGTTVEELTGKLDADFARSEAEVKQFLADDLEVIRSGKPKNIPEEQITDSQGNLRTLNTTKIPFNFSGAATPAVLGVAVDITERKRVETELRESESRLLTVLESSPIPIALNSFEGGVILYANSAMEELLGIPLTELVGSQAADFYANPEDRLRLLAEVSRRGSLRDHQVMMKRANGSAFWASLSSEKTHLEGQDCILSCVYDISEQKRAEALQSAVYQISEAANRSSGMDELYRSVHSIIGQVMPARNFYIALYDEENDVLSFPYYVDEVDEAPSILPSRPGRGMTEYVLRLGKPVISDQANFEELARLREVELVGPPSPIWIGAPLNVDGRTIGVIALQDYHDPKVYTERELRMLEYVSDQVAKAIERTRLHEETQRKNRILTALQEATLSIMRQTELSEVLQAILTQASGLFDSTSSYIYLVSSDESELVLVLALGQGEHFTGMRLKPGEGLAGRVWQTGEAIHVPDYQTWEGRSEKFANTSFHSILGVPLFVGDRVVGVLGITHVQTDRKFNRDDVELLSRFAQLASIAYENARLFTLSRQELAERKMAEEALRVSEDRFRRAVMQAPIPIQIHAEDGEILIVNDAWLHQSQYSREEIPTLSDWIHRAYAGRQADIQAEIDRLYQIVESMHEGEDVILTGAGEKRIWDFNSSPLGVLPDGRRIVISMAKDVTAQKHAESLQAAVYRISDATSSNIGMDEFYRVVHEALKSVMVAENFYIALYDRESDLLSFPYYADERDDAPRTAPLGGGPTGYVIRKGEPLFGKSETMKVLEEQGILVPAGTRSIDWLGVPLKIRNETIGVMAVQTYDRGIRYTQRDLDILGYVSTQVASSIERKQAEEDLQTSEMRYRLSARATNDVIWEWDIVSDEEVWSENLHPLFGYDVEAIDTQDFWWEDHIHPQDRQRVLEKLNDTLLNDENIWEDEYRFKRNDGSMAYIVDRGYIERNSNGKPVRMIGAMSDITDRRRREEELEALASVSAALRVAGSRTEILQVVLDQILLRFDARGAVLILRRTSTDELVVEGARGEWANFLGTRAPMNGSVSRHVMTTGKPHVENDLSAETLLSLNGLAKGVGSFVSAPLSTPSGMIGALNLGRAAPFRPEDVRLVMNIADMAANAIQRASAYEQMKQQIERIKVLRTIDLFIASGADLHLTMQTILNQAVAHLGIDAADILALNPSVHALEFAEGIGFRTAGVRQTSLRLGEGFAGQAVLKREMIAVEDIALLKNHPLFMLEGFIRYYGVPLIAKGDVKGVMEVLHRAPLDVDRDWLDFLESLAAQAALAMDNASLFSSLQRSNLELGIAYEATLEGWSAALDLRDKETEGHTQRVTNLTLALAEAMGVSEKDRVQIRRGALLHDIGKMGIPDRILLKPDVLTGEEWEIMRQHPVYAYKLLYPIPHLRPALDIPYCHHERWDGSGYPRGLKEEAIPLAARIFAVADVWDALCSDRPYRPAWVRETALSYIKSLSGVHFDPKVIEVFLKLI